MRSNIQSILTYAAVGLTVIILIWIILLTNQISEFKKYMPVAELDFPDNDLYHVDFARIYAVGKGVAPNEKLELNMHITNKQDLTLQLHRDIIIFVGGEPSKHLLNPVIDEVTSKSSKDLNTYDFYLAEEGPNEVRVSIRAVFPNGTMRETEPAITTIDVISLSNQLQLEQNKYTSYGIIISAIIGIATVIALIASLHFSQKEITSLESQNSILKEESVRPYLQPTIIQKGPVNIALSLKNVGTGAAIQVSFEYEIEGKSETKRTWKKPLVDKEESTNFLIPTGAGSKDFQLGYEYFKQNPTKIITKTICENIHGKQYTTEETIDVTEYVSQFEKILEEAKDD